MQKYLRPHRQIWPGPARASDRRTAENLRVVGAIVMVVDSFLNLLHQAEPWNSQVSWIDALGVMAA